MTRDELDDAIARILARALVAAVRDEEKDAEKRNASGDRPGPPLAA